MKKLFYTISVLCIVTAMILLHGIAVQAQETGALQQPSETQQTASIQQPTAQGMLNIARMEICRDVLNREPQEAGESFGVAVGKLYCFTKIVGAQEPIEITHAWYFGENEKARVNLSVRSSSWRTYSSKNIQNDEVGEWRVDVLGPDGKVLKTQTFNITQ